MIRKKKILSVQTIDVKIRVITRKSLNNLSLILILLNNMKREKKIQM